MSNVMKQRYEQRYERRYEQRHELDESVDDEDISFRHIAIFPGYEAYCEKMYGRFHRGTVTILSKTSKPNLPHDAQLRLSRYHLL